MEINTQEDFDSFLKSEVGYKLAQPTIDRKVQTGIETFMKNKNIPDLTARLETIEKAVNEKDSKIKKMELDGYLYKACNKQNVPYDLVNDYDFQDTKSIDLKIESYKREIGNVKTKNLNDFIAENKFNPFGGNSKIGITKASLSNISQKEMEAFESTGALDAMIEHLN